MENKLDVSFLYHIKGYLIIARKHKSFIVLAGQGGVNLNFFIFS